MRKLIKLDKIYDIKFDSKIHSFLSPEHIYIPIETGFDLLKKQNSKVLMGEAILENKKTIRNVDKHLVKKGIRSDIIQEGYSTRSEKWQNNISSTIDIVKDEWNK